MKIINKDILTVESGYILHGCNAQRAMGSGVALALKSKYPIVFDSYCALCDEYPFDFLRLGKYNFARINKDLAVINIISQLHYGYDGKRYSDYSAINQCFTGIAADIHYMPNNQVYLPYKIFSDRGGADWQIVSKMIDFYFPNAIVCKL